MWANPLSNVMGSWGLYNEQGELTTEAIENLALFIPFAVLLLWALQEKYWKENLKFGQILWRAVKTVFLFSLCIEFAQLFFRLGTFQISDLVYNTLGGAIGGILYLQGVNKGAKGNRNNDQHEKLALLISGEPIIRKVVLCCRNIRMVSRN